MGKAVDRLEMAGQTELVGSRVLRARSTCQEERRRKIHHVHGASGSLRNSRYRQKYDEYAI